MTMHIAGAFGRAEILASSCRGPHVTREDLRPDDAIAEVPRLRASARLATASPDGIATRVRSRRERREVPGRNERRLRARITTP